jgi:7-keto-8-aminopelargonate synthetase-like enzyme
VHGARRDRFFNHCRELVEMCRQRARPYLFSNTIAPVVVAGVLWAADNGAKVILRQRRGQCSECFDARLHRLRETSRYIIS